MLILLREDYLNTSEKELMISCERKPFFIYWIRSSPTGNNDTLSRFLIDGSNQVVRARTEKESTFAFPFMSLPCRMVDFCVTITNLMIRTFLPYFIIQPYQLSSFHFQKLKLSKRNKFKKWLCGKQQKIGWKGNYSCKHYYTVGLIHIW